MPELQRKNRGADLGESGYGEDVVYAVTTTGVYCRMTCPSKRPRPENIRHFETPSAAEAAGFRACKRCTPNSQAPEVRQATLIAAACRAIETSESAPSLAQLAQAAGLSSFHFQRVFRSLTGITPKQYATAHRSRRAQSALANGVRVSEALYDAGFSAPSRFYASSQLGMKPSAARAGGSGVTIQFATGACSLGMVLVAQSDRGVCAILLGDHAQELERELRERFPHATCIPQASPAVQEVARFIETPARGLSLPLDIQGTAFQQRVWSALRDIAAGTTISYAELARRVESPRSMRAVASACAANPIAVAIPCHRVLRSNGDLAGYRWGLARKKALLDREASE